MPVPQTDPISPRTVANLVQGFDINDPTRLRGLVDSLIQTIRQRDRIHHQEQDEYAATMADLHQKLAESHWEAFRDTPPGYEDNNRFPLLTINQGNGIRQPIKWIKMLNNCTVAGFAEGDRPGSTPHIFHVYAQPTTQGEPVEPLPAWFEELLIGPMPQYHTIYEAARELEDWGISADMARIRNFDMLEQEAATEIRKWEARMAASAAGRRAAQGRLEGARAAYQLAHFEHLGPIRERGQFTRRGQVSPTAARGRANVGRG